MPWPARMLEALTVRSRAWMPPAQDSPPASRMNRRGAARTYHMYLFWGAPRRR